jgi:hypothetical protein
LKNTEGRHFTEQSYSTDYLRRKHGTNEAHAIEKFILLDKLLNTHQYKTIAVLKKLLKGTLLPR